jgi:hypothetical protein
VTAGGLSIILPVNCAPAKPKMPRTSDRSVTGLMATLLDSPYTSRQATYDLRRLRRKKLIERLPHSHRYQLTDRGRRVAVLFTKNLRAGARPRPDRVRSHPARRACQTHPVAIAWRTLNRELDRHINNGLAAA